VIVRHGGERWVSALGRSLADDPALPRTARIERVVPNPFGGRPLAPLGLLVWRARSGCVSAVAGYAVDGEHGDFDPISGEFVETNLMAPGLGPCHTAESLASSAVYWLVQTSNATRRRDWLVVKGLAAPDVVSLWMSIDGGARRRLTLSRRNHAFLYAASWPPDRRPVVTLTGRRRDGRELHFVG
jgi:hypothetical protein